MIEVALGWTPNGSITVSGDGLRIAVTFGSQEHVGYVDGETVARLYLGEEDEPATIRHEGAAIGSLCRSPSGKGVVVSLAAGECAGAWKNFIELITGTRRHCILGVRESR